MEACKKQMHYYCVPHVLLELGLWCLKYNFSSLWGVVNSQSPNPLLSCSPPPPPFFLFQKTIPLPVFIPYLNLVIQVLIYMFDMYIKAFEKNLTWIKVSYCMQLRV